MLPALTNVTKWASFPVLLVASILLSRLAPRYGLLLDLLVCMGAIILVQRAVGRHRYVSGAGLAAVVVVFSPLFLVLKIFLLLGLTCVVACIALIAVFPNATFAGRLTGSVNTNLRLLPIIAPSAAIPALGVAQAADPLGWQRKVLRRK